ncbi:outer dynein arm-docking complex subunit 4-like, partial [Halyomorpha halys]
KKIKRIKDAYNQIYLNRAATDHDLLESCLNNRSLFLGNKKQNVLLRKILEDALNKLVAAKTALWRRTPLYTREQDILSKRLKLFNANKQDSKKADLEIVVNLRIAALDNAFHQDNHPECFKTGDELRSFLFLQSERDLPSKNDAMVTVISILGDLFLKNKSLLPTTGSENDERLLVLFGFQEPQKLTHELFCEKSFHPKIPRLKKFLEAKLEDLKYTTQPLERAYLCHEIGVAYCFKGVPFVTRKYAREAIFASKAARDRKWLLNSMFLLARSEIQQGNMNQGRVSLNGLMAAAEKFGYPDLKYLAIRAYELTTLKGYRPASTASGDFEKKIIKAMCTHEYTINAMKFLQKARTSPPDKRFPSSKDANSGDKETITRLEEDQTYFEALNEAKRRATLTVNEDQF